MNCRSFGIHLFNKFGENQSRGLAGKFFCDEWIDKQKDELGLTPPFLSFRGSKGTVTTVASEFNTPIY